MRIDIDQLKEEGTLVINEVLDFSNLETNDALVKSVRSVNATATAVDMGNNEYHITMDYTAEVNYLDARTLAPLDLTFDFHDDVIFSSDFQKAEEFELEYFEGDEIELDELLFALTCVRMPINYSEDGSDTIRKESEAQFENKPFADIFKNN